MYLRNSPLLIPYSIAVLVRQYVLVILFAFTIFKLWDNHTVHIILSVYIITAFSLNFTKIFFDWLFFKYQITEKNILLAKGSLFKSSGSIPLYKIQAFNEKQPFIYRLFRQVNLELDLGADSDEGKIAFKMISLKESRRIQQVLEKENPLKKETATPQESKALYSTSLKDIWIMSLISLQMLLIVPFLFFLYNKSTNFEWTMQISNFFIEQFQASAASKLLILLVLLPVSLLYGFLIFYIKYGKFRLHTDGHHLHMSNGLLNKKSTKLDKRKIKVIIYSSNFILAFFNTLKVQAITANSAMDFEKNKNMVLPLIKKTHATYYMNEIIPDFKLQHRLSGTDKRALIISFAKWCPLLVLLFYPGLLSLKIAALGVFLYALLLSNSTKYNINFKTDALFLKTGILKTTVYATYKRDIERIAVKQGFLQRAFKVKTVYFYIRGNPAKRITLRYLPNKEERKIAAWHETN